MKKVKIKRIPFKLNGEVISEGNILSFKGINRNNKEVSIDDVKGVKIISIFPNINTKVCDAQTQLIAKYATQNKNISFIYNHWWCANN